MAWLVVGGVGLLWVAGQSGRRGSTRKVAGMRGATSAPQQGAVLRPTWLIGVT
jgi:hypothetical protein